MNDTKRIGYLYSRYPVVSQTFCDSEMMALEEQGLSLVIGSLNPPPNSFRHERLAKLKAEIHYPPPSLVLKKLPLTAEVTALVEEHDRRYGASFKSSVRARNAAYFARLFQREGVSHVHVHFANRATHTALFLKKMGMTFSFTAHAQDFMVDLGSDELLRELAREAEFVIGVSDYSCGLLRERCPASAEKILRVYNGLQPEDFPTSQPARSGPLRLLSIGRLIEFKGFHHLIAAIEAARNQGVPMELSIVGEGPWQERLQAQIDTAGLSQAVQLHGVKSQEQIKLMLEQSEAFVLACCVDEKGASDILPTVIMEAMAAQLPIISTQLVGVPEMVQSGKTGWLTPPADVPALTAALIECAQNPEERKKRGEAGAALCAERFDRRVTGRQVAELLKPYAQDKKTTLASAAIFSSTDGLSVGEKKAAEAAKILVLTPEGAVKEDEALAYPFAQEALPAAIVLEAAWQASPNFARQCERLFAEGHPPDGEEFFRDARRAVYLADLVKKRGWRHLHAARAADLRCVWLVHQLTQVRWSFTIEPAHEQSASTIATMIKTAAFGSIADPALAAKIEGEYPDVLGLTPPAPKKLFSRSVPAAVDYAAWARRLVTF